MVEESMEAEGAFRAALLACCLLLGVHSPSHAVCSAPMPPRSPSIFKQTDEGSVFLMASFWVGVSIQRGASVMGP